MTEPITVPATAARDLTWQAIRAAVIFGSAVVASQLYRDAIVTGAATALATAVVAAVPALIAYGVGAYKTLRNHNDRRRMAQVLPDAVAQVETKA